MVNILHSIWHDFNEGREREERESDREKRKREKKERGRERERIKKRNKEKKHNTNDPNVTMYYPYTLLYMSVFFLFYCYNE